jgi:hypothetical protein
MRYAIPAGMSDKHIHVRLTGGLGEFDSLDNVCRIGRGIAEHRTAFVHWASVVSVSDADLYPGKWTSWRADELPFGRETSDLHLFWPDFLGGSN